MYGRTNRVMFDVPGIGELRLNKVLFEANSPLFYTVVDDQRRLYICSYCFWDLQMRKWVISPVSTSTLIGVLRDEITLRDCFLISKKDKITAIFTSENGKVSYNIESYDKWYDKNKDDLPVEGEYMEVDDGEFDEEIQYFQSYSEME